MVTNFEKVTEELTEDELKLIPMLISGFKTHTKENPITAPEIVKQMTIFCNKKKNGLSITETRLRKCVNYIRSKAMLPVIATSKGYYVSSDIKEIEKQIKSLQERAASITNCANGLKTLLNGCV